MTISQTQLVDILYKKLSGVSKTDVATAKAPANESNASPQLSPGSTIWQQDYYIPNVTVLPTSNSSVVTIYRDSTTSTIPAVSLSESVANQTWATNLTDWIPPQFGAGYQVKLYAGPSGSTTPQNYTNLPVGGTGNSDSWYFDYSAGIVNFADTNVPVAVAGNVVYVVGARYTGVKGINNFANIQVANISINGNTISGNVDLTLSGNVTISSTTNSTNNYNGALHVAGGASITSDLWVGGNVYTSSIVSENISILSVADPLLYLTANTPYPYNYDLGFYSHFVGGSGNVYQHTGIIRNHNDNTWYFFSNAAEPAGGLVDLANANIVFDTIKAGALTLANTTISSSYTTGALVVAGGAGINGNVNISGNISTTSNGYFTIPTGTSSQRPGSPQLGMIRYNSTISSFEGFGAGSAWSSLGGVKSVDGHAYITAEAYAGSGDDILRFYAGDTGVSTQVMWASNANIAILSSSNSISSTTGALQVAGGVGIVGNLYIGGNTHITGNANIDGNLTTVGNILSNNFVGNVFVDLINPNKTSITIFNSNTAVGMPVGDTTTRPSPIPGLLRYNTDISAVEYYNGVAWISVTNNVVDQIIYADGITNSFTLNQTASASGILVSINGVLQLPGQAYTIDASNNIVFGQIPTDSDIIDVRFLGPLISSPDTVASDLTVVGNLTIGGILTAPQITKASNAIGTVGQVCWDNNYIYVCTATNTWKRSTLTGGY